MCRHSLLSLRIFLWRATVWCICHSWLLVCFAFPSIIIAEKYRKMRGIFLTAITGIIAGLLLLIFGYQSKYVLLAGLGIFFIAFNVMEALLPSWLSKSAPIQSKATAMG